MRIHPAMNHQELLESMGPAATDTQALMLREHLINTSYQDINEIQEDDWLRLLDLAVRDAEVLEGAGR